MNYTIFFLTITFTFFSVKAEVVYGHETYPPSTSRETLIEYYKRRFAIEAEHSDCYQKAEAEDRKKWIQLEERMLHYLSSQDYPVEVCEHNFNQAFMFLVQEYARLVTECDAYYRFSLKMLEKQNTQQTDQQKGLQDKIL